MFMLSFLPFFVFFNFSYSQFLGQDTAVVNLRRPNGPTFHLASGLLYGVPEAENQIPADFYHDIGFNYLRAGGAQIPAPGRGWIYGQTEYANRFKSALSDYRMARSFGAVFIFLIHDLWGADGTQPKNASYPGDGGDWSSWDMYLTRIVVDMKANDMLDQVQIDIWNEPDLAGFWNRGLEQWLDLWGRTYYRLRTELPGVQLIGPAYAGAPDSENPWWTSFLDFVKSNASIPDQWVWHMEGGDRDLDSSVAVFNDLLQDYDLPKQPLNIDEYGTFAEQNPAGAAWWISQLERNDAHGLRGNWLMGNALHDMMASLLSKPGAEKAYSANATGYYPNGEFQVYKYYNLEMTRRRLSTTASGDKKLDVYATLGDHAARILAGVRLATGTWQIRIEGLSALALNTSGTVNITRLSFPFTGGHYGRVDEPINRGTTLYEYEDDVLTIELEQSDNSTAYAFEIPRGAFTPGAVLRL